VSRNHCDLIIDLGAPPNFEPVDGFAAAIKTQFERIADLDDFRTFTMLGCSFPESLVRITTFVGHPFRFQFGQ